MLKYSEAQLTEAVKQSICWAEVCRKVGVKPGTGSQTYLANRARKLGIDHSHFRGRKWKEGRKFPEACRPIEEYLVKDSTAQSAYLRKLLISRGIKERKCEICNLTEWQGEPIPLELDHKDGDHWNCTLPNLQIICPNCHALETEKRRSTPSGERTRLERVEAKAIAGSTPVSGTKHCWDCDVKISFEAIRCKKCAAKGRGAKIHWPVGEELLSRLANSNYSRLARELGISDNAIRKHMRIYGIIPNAQMLDFT